jgi:hypothetical protein
MARLQGDLFYRVLGLALIFVAIWGGSWLFQRLSGEYAFAVIATGVVVFIFGAGLACEDD